MGAAGRIEDSAAYPRWVLLTALAGVFASTFPITVLAVSLGDIARDLGTTSTTVVWVITAPMLGYAVSMPVLGKLGDLYGHRRVYLAGFALATVSAAATALAWNALSLIALRTVTQVLGGATVPTALGLIMSVHGREERVRAMGWWSLVGAGAPVVGLVAGGPLVEAFGWRPIFVAQACFAALAVGLALLVLRETPRRAAVRFDVAGAVWLAVGVGALLFAVNRGAEWGWTHAGVAVAAAVVPVALARFVRVERRAVEPLLPLALFARPNFTFPLLSQFAQHFSYMGGFILTPLLVRFVFGYSLTHTALLMLFRPAVFSAASPLGGVMATRFGERTMALVGAVAVAASMVAFATGAAWHSIGLVVVGLCLTGAGAGLSQPSLAASVANEVGDEHVGMGGAALHMAAQIGSAIGIALLTAVQAGRDTAGAHVAAYGVGLAVAVAGVVAARSVRSLDRGTAPTPATDSAIDSVIDSGAPA